MEKNKNIPTGFSYYVKDGQLQAYNSWPIEKRLEWLYAVNILRKGLPSKVKKIRINSV